MACSRIWIVAVSLVALGSSVVAPGFAQTHCRPADSTGAEFLAEVTQYAAAESPNNAAVRDSLRLQPTPKKWIKLVEDETVCSQAAAAYRRELTTAAETHTGRVYVIQARDRYAVLDVDYHIAPRRPTLHGTNWIIVIFDATWGRLSLF
jgi:hypothetical protein